MLRKSFTSVFNEKEEIYVMIILKKSSVNITCNICMIQRMKVGLFQRSNAKKDLPLSRIKLCPSPERQYSQRTTITPQPGVIRNKLSQENERASLRFLVSDVVFLPMRFSSSSISPCTQTSFTFSLVLLLKDEPHVLNL